jgi:hypothetical protein
MDLTHKLEVLKTQVLGNPGSCPSDPNLTRRKELMSNNLLLDTSRKTRWAVLVLALAIITQFSAHPITLASIRQEPAGPATEVLIPDGTEFTVITTEEITSKTATEGDPLTFKIADDLKIDGHVVIAKDTVVKGVVASAKKAGMMGRGGSLGIRVESTTTVDNQKIKLRSSKGREGDDKTGTTVALVVLFGPLGFLKHGKNAKIKSGTQIKVYADEEKKVHVKS